MFGYHGMGGEDFSAVLDSLIWCKFLRKAFHDLYAESAAIYAHVTGWPMTAAELRQAGERINTLKKLFNIREGWRQADDTLPPRVLTATLPTGVVQGVGLTRADLDMMIQGYYRARGWTVAGLIPGASLVVHTARGPGAALVCRHDSLRCHVVYCRVSCQGGTGPVLLSGGRGA